MHKSKIQSKNPSFSSTLLDEIYNSIDARNPKTHNNANQKQSNRTRPVPHRNIFFGSLSSSSDSTSTIFSSSDTELTHHANKPSSRPLCFGPSKPKPRKTEGNALFYGNRASYRVFDDYGYRSEKSSGNFEKIKTPVSPGGRIVGFLSSLFTTHSRKTMAAMNNPRNTAKENRGHPSTCSSASSFSRSCLNRVSEKSSEGVKRSAGFSPVNSSGRSFVEEEISNRRNRKGTRFVSSSLPEEWKNIGKPQKKSAGDGGRISVEESAWDFLRDYRKNQRKSAVKNTGNDVMEDYEDDDNDDEDGASDSSSDLFELDLIGNHHERYRDELPVYETTCAALIL